MSLCANAPNAPKTIVAIATHAMTPDEFQPLDGKQHHKRAQQRIDADLGQQPAEQRAGHDARRMIGGRQPEIDRKGSRLHAEGQKKQRGDGHHRRGRPQSIRLACNVGHVERAEGAVEIAGGAQEQRRAEKVQDGVFRRAVDLLLLGAEDHQAEGSDQKHFEPDIEIEDVAGQKGAGDAAHHQQQKRVEAVAPADGADLAHRIDRAEHGDEGRRQRESAPSRSAVKAMPKGGSQLPIVMVTGPSARTRANSIALAPSISAKSSGGEQRPASADGAGASAGWRRRQ